MRFVGGMGCITPGRSLALPGGCEDSAMALPWAMDSRSGRPRHGGVAVVGWFGGACTELAGSLQVNWVVATQQGVARRCNLECKMWIHLVGGQEGAWPVTGGEVADGDVGAPRVGTEQAL